MELSSDVFNLGEAAPRAELRREALPQLVGDVVDLGRGVVGTGVCGRTGRD